MKMKCRKDELQKNPKDGVIMRCVVEWKLKIYNEETRKKITPPHPQMLKGQTEAKIQV
jgi:hypothetical protein